MHKTFSPAELAAETVEVCSQKRKREEKKGESYYHVDEQNTWHDSCSVQSQINDSDTIKEMNMQTWSITVCVPRWIKAR